MFARLILRGRRGCMARPRLPTLARHYSEAATAATVSEEVQDAPVPRAYWHPHLTLIQHVLGLRAGEEPPSELANASKFKDSAMFDALIVALDVESTIDNLPWSMIKEHGATAIGVSILDTRRLLRELRCDTHEARGLNSVIQPLQYYFRDERPKSVIFANRRVSKFSFGKTERLHANDVSTKLNELFDGRDVITVFHNSHNDTAMLKYLDFDTPQRSLLGLDTYLIAQALRLPPSLEDLSTLLFVDPGNGHVAGDDAMATIKTLSMLAALATDPLISTPNPQGAQLGRLLFDNESDFSWLAGQFPRFLGRTLEEDTITKDANMLKHHLPYLLDEIVRARQSLDKEMGSLQLRHWRLRSWLAHKQLLLHNAFTNKRLLQKEKSKTTLQREEQHRQPPPQQLAPSAKTSRQPLPLPSTDATETSRLQATTTTVDRHDDDVELIPIQREREGFDARLFSRHIDHIVRVRHHLHQQCLSIILFSLQAKCSIFIHRWERWAASRHKEKNYQGKKFLTLTRPFFHGMMSILSRQVERTPSALREKSLEQLNNLVCPLCQKLLSKKGAKSLTMEELLMRPEILWPFPQHLYGPPGSIRSRHEAVDEEIRTRPLPSFPQHLYGYGGIIRTRHKAEDEKKLTRPSPPLSRHLDSRVGRIRSRHKAEDKMAWKPQSQPASTIGRQQSALAWEAAWAGKVIVR